jgi:hypothetical protein
MKTIRFDFGPNVRERSMDNNVQDAYNLFYGERLFSVWR